MPLFVFLRFLGNLSFHVMHFVLFFHCFRCVLTASVGLVGMLVGTYETVLDIIRKL